MMKKTVLELTVIFAAAFAAGAIAYAPVPTTDSTPQSALMANMMTNLQSLRFQIILYTLHHGGRRPDGVTSEEWIGQLTKKTKSSGRIDAAGPYGPYLAAMPPNAFNQSVDVLIDIDGTIQPGTVRTRGWDAYGWYYNTITGKFSPNDSPEHGRL
jgi:hypothetical protein